MWCLVDPLRTMHIFLCLLWKNMSMPGEISFYYQLSCKEIGEHWRKASFLVTQCLAGSSMICRRRNVKTVC